MKRWTKAEEKQLRATYAELSLRDTAKVLGRSVWSVKCRKNKIGARRLNGKWRKWRPLEKARLRALYSNTRTSEIAEILQRSVISVHAQAYKMGLKKTPEHIKKLLKVEAAKLQVAGAAHRFRKGIVPANKGLRRPGYAPGRMAETWFKKGQWPGGHKPRVPIGATRTNSEGYLDRKIRDTGYPPRDWRAVHLLLWEEVNGPLPRGYTVTFKDGNRKNVEFANLELISRAELMRRNTIHRYPPELKDVMRITGRLRKKIEEASSVEEHRRSS